MKPVEFEGVNAVYAKDQPQYLPLPVNRSENGNLIACFQIGEKELEEIKRTGKLWISIMTFNQPLQPIVVSAYELEHNVGTGGITYKNLPDCNHEMDERGFCKHCHLKYSISNPN